MSRDCEVDLLRAVIRLDLPCECVPKVLVATVDDDNHRVLGTRIGEAQTYGVAALSCDADVSRNLLHTYM